MSLLFKNFEAASRKRNMAGFGMFPSDRDLSWIANAEDFQTAVTVPWSATPTFDLADGTIQRILLTANVTSSSFVFEGGLSIPDGMQFWLHVIQNATGGWTFALPATVRNPGTIKIGADPNTMTTFIFEYRSGGWDFIAPPVEGPRT